VARVVTREVEFQPQSAREMTKSDIPFELPIPAGGEHRPVWTGRAFQVGERYERVLAFGCGSSGWTDALTTLHEDASGGNHFIDLASRRHALGELQRVIFNENPVIMEVGCSSGYFLGDLVAELPRAVILGADYTLGTLEILGKILPQIPLFQFDLTDCPLPDNSLDAVVILNVLEHIERDDLAISQVHRVLRAGGIIVCEVPAGPSLYDRYDRALLHFRRYSMKTLTKLLKSSGFELINKSHLGFFIFPAFWISKKISRFRHPSLESASKSNVEKSIARSSQFAHVAHALMQIEDQLRQWIYLFFGVRCLITGRKL
jgi:SAM-dependent methyltransferase